MSTVSTGGGSSTGGQTPAGGSALYVIGPQPQAPISVPGWIGIFAGMNRKSPASMIGEWEAQTIENLLIDGRSLKLRGGRTVVMDTLTATPWTTHGGVRVYPFGTAYDVIAGNFAGTNKIKSNRTGAWADVLSGYSVGTENRVEFVVGTSALYVLFGHASQQAQKITTGDVTANTTWSAGTPTIMPSLGMFHKRRLWLDDVGNKGRVWLSDADAPDTMRNQSSATIVTQGGYFPLDLPGGDTITAMASWAGQGVFFSQRSMHFVTGSNFSNMTVIPVPGVGTKSPRSVRVCENDLWFLDSDGIERFISGSQPNVSTTVALGVPGYYLEPMTTAVAEANRVKMHAVYQNRRYWLFDPTGSQAWCWDFRELPVPGSRWTYHSAVPFGYSWIAGGAGDSNDLYVLKSTAPTVCKFLNGTTDEGAAIAYKWKSRAYDWQAPQWEKGMERVAPQLIGVTGAVTMNLYQNLAASAQRSFTLTYAGGTFERQETKLVGSDVQGQVVQVEMTGSTAAFECAGIQIEPQRKRHA